MKLNFFISLLFIVLMANIIFSQNLEVNLCDDDGYATFNMEEIGDYVLQNIGLENEHFLEEVLISTSIGYVYSVSSPSNNPSIKFLCDLSEYGGLTDVAVDSNQKIFLSTGGSGGAFYSVDDGCNLLFNYNDFFYQSNALSFDDISNIYLGSGIDSEVYRFNVSGTILENFELWHDFEAGASGGDYVLLNNKMYVSWRLSNNNYRLYEVLVDDGRNYISHKDLGKLPNRTYGLASELGKLYGVTPEKLFEINLSNITFKDVIQNSNAGEQWTGAAGLHEAKVFITSIHLTLNDAEKDINEISGDWVNSVVEGQTIYIRVENSSTKEYEIVSLDLNVIVYPNVNTPLDLEKCYTDAYNVFDLNQVSTQMQIDATDDLSFTYYNTDPEINTTANRVSSQYQSTEVEETLYVSVQKGKRGCNSIYSFQVKNIKNPNLLPISNTQLPTTVETCYFDKNDIGYFDLHDIKNDIILDAGNFEISYYQTLLDAENNNNELSNIYYLEVPVQELFIKVTNEEGCYTISNFYLKLDCYANNNTLTSAVFPKFITPNNDGINDFWNIKGVSEKVKKESTIIIFNRYGKALYAFKPYSIIGWDGTYKGEQLPVSDYWFVFISDSGLKRSGHFTLKR